MEPIPGTPEGPLHVAFTADSHTAIGMAWAFVTVRMLGGRRLIPLAVFVVGAVYLGVANGVLVQVVIGLVIFLGTITLSLYRSAARLFRRLYPPNSSHTVTFTDRTMTVTGVLGTAENRYEAFSTVAITGRAATLGLKGTSTVMFLPRELVPEHARELLRSQLTR